MVSTRHRGGEVRQFILEHVEKHPCDIVALTAQAFGLSRQGVHRHIQSLRKEKALRVYGTTRNRRYKLRPLAKWLERYPLRTIEGEDVIWSRDIRPLLRDLPENVLDILQYGFTEILNNAIEHSSGKSVLVCVQQTGLDTRIVIWDDGEGIFKKLKRELGLTDERHAVLELAKGKVTTDPVHHTGEGIFFTSRMFDSFSINSGNIWFAHNREKEDGAEPLDWIFEDEDPQREQGTVVHMDLRNNVSRTPKEVFDQFTSEEEYGFTRTVIPVRLAQYGDEKLVSRSQAKRLLAGIDRFKVVMLDFDGVATIGQAFADEVFRVFVAAHPEVELYVEHVSTPVQEMIRHVSGAGAAILLGYLQTRNEDAERA
jgi:anti-sigma regulatory factor (Ser/Thr protein kinase)